MLGGRRDERAVLDGLLDEARVGRSGVLVLRGEAGIGKTALLEHASESASDFTLLRTVGVESEVELAFAALHQLCAPVDDFVDRLPTPQRDVLEITFGVSAGAAPDRFLAAQVHHTTAKHHIRRRPSTDSSYARQNGGDEDVGRTPDRPEQAHVGADHERRPLVRWDFDVEID